MNGTKTFTTGLLLAALSISGSGVAQEAEAELGGAGLGVTDSATIFGELFGRTVRETPASPGSATYIERSISGEDIQRPGNATAYDPATGQTVFIPTIVPPDVQVPGPDNSGDTISRSIPDLPPDIAQATVAELLDSPYLSDVDIDRDSIPPDILNGEVGDLLGTPGMLAMVNSMITKEQFDTLFDAINNNSGQIVSDMLDNVQMPTGTGT